METYGKGEEIRDMAARYLEMELNYEDCEALIGRGEWMCFSYEWRF